MIDKPVVTVHCITYNHEQYIGQCLEGFVMQQTSFDFEAVVHDDASTDTTATIIAQFAEKYPNIIKPLYETENQYSKGNGSLKKIMDAHMSGKYIAICEGDDYWTDPHKLQKQYDFMEANPEYSMCFHRAEVISDLQSETSLYQNLEQRDYCGNEILSKWIVPTCSTFMVREAMLNIPTDSQFKCGDNVLFAYCAKIGKIRCLGDEMAVYRRHETGATRRLQPEGMLLHWTAMKKYFPEFKHSIDTLILTNRVRVHILKGKSESTDTLRAIMKSYGFFRTLRTYVRQWLGVNLGPNSKKLIRNILLRK